MSRVISLPPRSGGGETQPSAPASPEGFSGIDEILSELRAGRMVLILDDEDRENEGDLIMAAELATPEAVAFMIRYTSGIICVPMEAERLARLELPQMVPHNDDAYRTAFTISVDYRFGTTTGVSSGDRAATIRALANPDASPKDFARPGHIFPLRPREGGVLVRAGHTEAAVDLCKLAGLQPVGVLCEVMNDDGTMARRPELERFARTHQLKIGTIADLIRYRLRNERSVDRVADHAVQTEFGEFRLYVYEDHVHHGVHFALAHGNLEVEPAPLVRVHVADTMRDLLGISGDPNSWTLRAALERIAKAPSGVLVVLRKQEYASDIADVLRGLPPAPYPPLAGDRGPRQGDGVLRTYGLGAQILKDVGVRRMRVLSAPKQMHGISAFDLEIEGYVGEGA